MPSSQPSTVASPPSSESAPRVLSRRENCDETCIAMLPDCGNPKCLENLARCRSDCEKIPD